MAGALLITASPNAAAQSASLGGMGWTSDLTQVPGGSTAPCVVCTGGNPITKVVFELPTTQAAIVAQLATMAAQEAQVVVPQLPAVRQLAQMLATKGTITAAQLATILAAPGS